MPNYSSSDNVLTNGQEEMTLGGRLYASRINAGMSPNMVANLVGVKPSTLKSWENDRSEPRVNKLVALAGVLGVSPTHFLAEEGNDGINVSATRGRRSKLIEMLKEEMTYIREYQKQLSQRIRRIDTIIQKL